MTELKRQCGARGKKSDEEKGEGRKRRRGVREGLIGDCGSGIKLPICILLRMAERRRRKYDQSATGMKKWQRERES